MTKRYRLTLSGMYKDDDGDWVKYEEVERLQARIDELDKGYAQLQKFVDAQADDAALWGYAQYISEAYIQRGLRGCHAFIEQTIKALEGEGK